MNIVTVGKPVLCKDIVADSFGTAYLILDNWLRENSVNIESITIDRIYSYDMFVVKIFYTE